jgi:hypothetical protein
MVKDRNSSLGKIPENKRTKKSNYVFMNGMSNFVSKAPVEKNSYKILTTVSSNKTVRSSLTSPKSIFSPQNFQNDSLNRVTSITENGILRTILNKAQEEKHKKIQKYFSKV